MPLYEETEVELIVDVENYIEKTIRDAKHLIIIGICLIVVVGIGIPILIFGIISHKRSPQDRYKLIKKHFEGEASKKGKQVRYINIPKELE